jgi:NAD(P)-dependent dehydrogenase (short-subunit alcohol dehydrogenase family)
MAIDEGSAPGAGETHPDPAAGLMRNDEFAGKVALVTGAGAGIGRSIAIEWAAHGGTVLVTDIDEASANAVAAEIGGAAHGMKVDVKNLDAIREAVTTAVRIGGGLDALFNVAGINIPRNVEEMEEDDWYAVLDTNLTSIYRTCKFAIPEMRKRGGGAIVNVASVAGILAENRCGAYSASKGGVMLLTRNLAMDFAKDNIRVNAVCPGSTRTPRLEKYWQKSPTGKSEIAVLAPMRRSAEPEEIAKPAIFLASSDASYITGASLVVDGGLSAGLNVPTFERM